MSAFQILSSLGMCILTVSVIIKSLAVADNKMHFCK